MAVPNIFGTATSAIPLSQLDTNFATPVTIGNTAVQLGNTVTSFGNVTLTNVTISSGNVTITGANVSGTANVSTLVVTSNQSFVGTGNRITGDFSNATVANRVAFQSSTTNGNTNINAFPNGTGDTATINFFKNAADLANSSTASFGIGLGSGTEVRATSGITGTGTYLPMTFYTGGSERARIDTSGNVGIGTTAPATKLDVYGPSGVTSFTGATRLGLTIEGATSTNDYSGIDFTTGGNVGRARIAALFGGGGSSLSFGTSNNYGTGITNTAMTIDSSAGITLSSLAGVGSRAVNASAAGLLSAASDSSLKEEVTNSHIAGLAEILQIQPKMYKWKEDIAIRGDDAAIELGFFANDVAPIIPSAAPKGNDGLYGFYDRSITAALVKAIQEQQALIQSLTTRITALEQA